MATSILGGGVLRVGLGRGMEGCGMEDCGMGGIVVSLSDGFVSTIARALPPSPRRRSCTTVEW